MNNIFYKIYEQLLLEDAIWQLTDEELNSLTIEEGLFADYLLRFYKNEYLLSALKHYEFTGVEVRRQNIIKHIENDLKESTTELQDTLLQLFEFWLKGHALLSPKTWAIERLNGSDDLSVGEILSSFLSEYKRYIHFVRVDYTSREPDPIPQTFWDDLNNNLPKMRETNKLITRLSEDENAQFTDLKDLIENAFDGELSNILSPEILIEFYRYLLFPKWFQYWKDQGIVQTRRQVEKVYKNLKAANTNNLGNLIVWINIAINTSHQTGSIIEYLHDIGVETDNLYKLLENLTKGVYTEKWNKQLQEIGVIIPKIEDSITRMRSTIN